MAHLIFFNNDGLLMFTKILKTLGILNKKTKKTTEEKFELFQGTFDSYLLGGPTQY
jgi:hypothetical protein